MILKIKIICLGYIEKWLLEVEQMMRQSLKEHAFRAFNKYLTINRLDWVMSFPGQIVLAINEVYSTKFISEVILLFL